MLNTDKLIIIFSPIFISLLISIILATIILTLSYVIVVQQADYEKISAYECGFQPFEEARTKFDVRVDLVAILFIIFDLEVMFLFPWSITLYNLDFFGIGIMYFFL